VGETVGEAGEEGGVAEDLLGREEGGLIGVFLGVGEAGGRGEGGRKSTMR